LNKRENFLEGDEIMGKMIRGVSKDARFIVLDSTDVVQEALDIHPASPTAIAAFGRLLTAGLMMGATLKGNDVLTLRTETDGAMKMMVVTTDATGGIKGYMSNPMADVPPKTNGRPDVAGLLGRGSLRIIKDMGLKEPYAGVSELVSGEIAEDVAYYYYVSEQTPSVVAIGVSLKDEKTVRSAGGYMIQLLPGASESFIDALEEKIKAIRSITELLEGGMDLPRIAKLLYEDMTDEHGEKLIEEYEILEEKEVFYSCNCDREKFYRGLITLGKEQLEEILKEQEYIEAECQFCGKKHSFSKEDFKEILEEKK
jgi:molecular chaperone Hsp33